MARISYIESKRSVMVSNLLSLWRQTTAVDRREGRLWYPRARRIIREWSEHYDYPRETVACVVAAISPQCPWERNLIIADDILARRAPSIGGIRANIDKAIAIRDNCAISTLDYFKSGPKVACFAANLAGDNTLVTIDTHAIQAALLDTTVSFGLRWPQYQVVAECYATAASKVNYRPATFQAIIWCAWKRLYSPEEKRAIKRRRR